MSMQVSINEDKKSIRLFFSEALPKGLGEFLKELGFKQVVNKERVWYADKHPSYQRLAEALKNVFMEDLDWRNLKLMPSFEPTKENIDRQKFSLVKIHYRGKNSPEVQDYVVFDSYKKVAEYIARDFAIQAYGSDFKDLEVFPRNYKRRARLLLEKGFVIKGTTSLKDKEEQLEIETSGSNNPIESLEEKVESIPIVTNKKSSSSALREITKEVVQELTALETTLTGESETIIGTTVMDLEQALETHRPLDFQNHLQKAIAVFKDWMDDLAPEVKQAACESMSKLTNHLQGTRVDTIANQTDAKSISKDIFSRDHIVQNVLVPANAGEPFVSGSLTIGDSNFLKFKFPNLYKIDDENLKEVSAVGLFQLAQMAHPTDYGINVHRSTMLQLWEAKGRELFEAIGYPTDLDYPYVNIHTGYKSVSRLGRIIGADADRHQWWSAVSHSRPLANLEKGVEICDELLIKLVQEQQEYINPRTNKPKKDKVSKEALSTINWDISQIEGSKDVIRSYIDKHQKKTLPTPNSDAQIKEVSKPQKKENPHQDYIDRVVAIMHTAFLKAERLTKKKVESLQEKVNAPSMGALWESVELSWLLWYRMLYKEPISFKARLQKMVHFWHNVQPTYAYSDSSKELYKQYSTPCPIGAIIAQYTQMASAEFIFEPSAGNGLLVVGADPNKTHVNEIDKSRKKSLTYQGFVQISADNAAEPFANKMQKSYDVVVTNPPFASWEASKFDKERIVSKYFDKHRGIARHIRLEHLMAGLALDTLKDDGKAAIIIMGHVYFGEDGLFAKYRPFFNWLYRHYRVDDIINMNSFKLYNKQGAVTKTMLILIGARKEIPKGVAPNKSEAPHLETMVERFEDLWDRVKIHIPTNKIDTIIEQLKIAKTR